MMPHVIEYSSAWFIRERIDTNFDYFGRRNDGKWVCITSNVRNRSEEKIPDLEERVACACGMQAERDFRWAVHLSLDSCGLDFLTDATGASEIFKLRDVPAGAKRRTALTHWVEEHWRADRIDPSVDHKVRAYLRGASTFDWNGLHCIIKPSQMDIKLEEELIEERADMKDAQADLRIQGEVKWDRKSWVRQFKKVIFPKKS